MPCKTKIGSLGERFLTGTEGFSHPERRASQKPSRFYLRITD